MACPCRTCCDAQKQLFDELLDRRLRSQLAEKLSDLPDARLAEIIGKCGKRSPGSSSKTILRQARRSSCGQRQVLLRQARAAIMEKHACLQDIVMSTSRPPPNGPSRCPGKASEWSFKMHEASLKKAFHCICNLLCSARQDLLNRVIDERNRTCMAAVQTHIQNAVELLGTHCFSAPTRSRDADPKVEFHISSALKHCLWDSEISDKQWDIIQMRAYIAAWLIQMELVLHWHPLASDERQHVFLRAVHLAQSNLVVRGAAECLLAYECHTQRRDYGMAIPMYKRGKHSLLQGFEQNPEVKAQGDKSHFPLLTWVHYQIGVACHQAKMFDSSIGSFERLALLLRCAIGGLPVERAKDPDSGSFLAKIPHAAHEDLLHVFAAALENLERVCDWQMHYAGGDTDSKLKMQRKKLRALRGLAVLHAHLKDPLLSETRKKTDLASHMVWAMRAAASQSPLIVMGAVPPDQARKDRLDVECARCGAAQVSQICPKCKLVGYCDSDCQARDWKCHERQCKRDQGRLLWMDIAGCSRSEQDHRCCVCDGDADGKMVLTVEDMRVGEDGHAVLWKRVDQHNAAEREKHYKSVKAEYRPLRWRVCSSSCLGKELKSDGRLAYKANTFWGLALRMSLTTRFFRGLDGEMLQIDVTDKLADCYHRRGKFTHLAVASASKVDGKRFVPTVSSFGDTRGMFMQEADEKSLKRTCAFCGVAAMAGRRKCSCGISYCGPYCQHLHWPDHKDDCKQH